jgi:hypothetical protein
MTDKSWLGLFDYDGSLLEQEKVLLLTMPKQSNDLLCKGGDPFRVLGISKDASSKAIKKAYRGLVAKYHPDVNHSKNAQVNFQIINEAYYSITKTPDIVELSGKCDMVKVKKEYSDLLFAIERLEVLTGIEQEFTPPANTNSEVVQKTVRLISCLTFKCPKCSVKVRCDRATRFDDASRIHNKLVNKYMSKQER